MNKLAGLALSLSIIAAAAPSRAEFLIGPRVTLTQPVAFASSTPFTSPELGAALDMRISNPSRMIQIGIGLQTEPREGDVGAFSLELGQSWFLGSSASWVPYVGAAMQLRALFFDDTAVYSLAAQGHVGVMSSRQGHRRFFAELRAVQNLLPFGAEYMLTKQSAPTPDGATRFEPTLAAGFLF